MLQSKNSALPIPGIVVSLLSFAGALGSIDDGDTITATASLGTSVQIGHFGIGVRTFGQAGVGLQLWAVSVDIGGAISIDDTVNYDGTDYPRTARLFAAVGMDF